MTTTTEMVLPNGVRLQRGSTYRYHGGDGATWKVTEFRDVRFSAIPAVCVTCVETGVERMLMPDDMLGMYGRIDESTITYPAAPCGGECEQLLKAALARVECMRDGIVYSAARPVEDSAKLADKIRAYLASVGVRAD